MRVVVLIATRAPLLIPARARTHHTAHITHATDASSLIGNTFPVDFAACNVRVVARIPLSRLSVWCYSPRACLHTAGPWRMYPACIFVWLFCMYIICACVWCILWWVYARMSAVVRARCNWTPINVHASVCALVLSTIYYICISMRVQFCVSFFMELAHRVTCVWNERGCRCCTPTKWCFCFSF